MSEIQNRQVVLVSTRSGDSGLSGLSAKRGDDASRVGCCDTTTSSSSSSSSSFTQSDDEVTESQTETVGQSEHQRENANRVGSPMRRKLFKQSSWKSNESSHETNRQPKSPSKPKNFRLRPRFNSNKQKRAKGDSSGTCSDSTTCIAAATTTTKTTTAAGESTKEEGSPQLAALETTEELATGTVASSDSASSFNRNSGTPQETTTAAHNENNNNNNNTLFQDEMDIVAYQEWPPQRKQRYRQQLRYQNGVYYRIQYPIQKSPSSVCASLSVETVATKLGRSPVKVSFDDVEMIHQAPSLPSSISSPVPIQGRIQTGGFPMPKHSGGDSAASASTAEGPAVQSCHSNSVTEKFLSAIENTLKHMTCSQKI